MVEPDCRPFPGSETAEESGGGVDNQVRATFHLAYTMTGMAESRDRPVSFHSTSSPPVDPEGRELGLYNGVSNRTRGWKSKTFGEFVENRVPAHSTVRRWDGRTKTFQPWDSLRRDPELWYRNGNCYVHLYGVGQSRRGPAFRVPFSVLLTAKCHPLLDRFLVPIVSPQQPPAGPCSMSQGNQPWGAARGHCQGSSSNRTPVSRFDLFIPPPPSADRHQAFLFHLATRNFFAWILRKPLVGKDLGSAMITLLNTMSDFRCHAENNVADLLSYLEDMGYLDFRNQPHFALAALHLAEFFQLRELYVDAFAHCTGMCDRLFLSPEYQHVSSISRKLIRRAKSDMDSKLNKAGLMLGNFLEEELSEAHLGLSYGARIHLDRFRLFLHAFYNARLGRYPPVPVEQRSSAFEPTIFHLMRHDFECLYSFLVDEGFNTVQDSPFLATGGICTLQSVQSFDIKHKFKSMPQPLPLLPQLSSASSRRKSWLGRNDRTTPDQRLLDHAALIRASNMEMLGLLDNDLVRGYRKFEEDFIFNPAKLDKAERISHVDARKVRWILVYGVYQTLRSVTEPPQDVRHSQGVPYHLAVATDLLPPWREDRVSYPPCSPHRMLSAYGSSRARAHSVSTCMPAPDWDPRTPGPQPLRIDTEIKPDVDYFALNHRSAATTQNTPASTPTTPRRSRSLTRGLNRNSTIRRSLSIFSRHSRASSPVNSPHSPPPPLPSAVPVTIHRSHRKSLSYHEIVVHGYGNGTNTVRKATEYVAGPGSPPGSPKASSPNTATTNRSLSNASKSSEGSTGSAATSTSASTAPSTAPSVHENVAVGIPKLKFNNKPESNSDPERAASTSQHTMGSYPEIPPRGRTMQLRREASGPPSRSRSVCSASSSHYSTNSPGPADTPSSRASPAPRHRLQKAGAAARQSRFRNTIGGIEDLVSVPGAPSGPKSMMPAPLRVQRDHYNLRLGARPEEWKEVKEAMDRRIRKDQQDDVKPMWEQFSDLGGLTPMG